MITGTDGSTQVNPTYTSSLNTDQTLLSLLYSSRTEESMSEVLGVKYSHEAWTALEASFSHRSKTHELQLKDELQLMQPGSKSVADFSHLFKGLYDQLAAIGRPIDDLDKFHWFLRALGLHRSSWYLDSNATSHMTNDLEGVDIPVVYFGNKRVMVGNGLSLFISHTGFVSTLVPNSPLLLSNVLVVPDRVIGVVLRVDRCENGLYVLQQHYHAFASIVSSNKLCLCLFVPPIVSIIPSSNQTSPPVHVPLMTTSTKLHPMVLLALHEPWGFKSAAKHPACSRL
ncbi:hypothetical protein POTOM_045435 [Populus tomentosa]|uniref:Retrotransposon gag domain-containing protein n=1 Tax=Populus tomentosa TaxID=118781 RepID=A0A8X8CDZ5_POPTO|nr:hypothetical protein POTOM_045435 [Populus tomentosa]